MVVLEAYFDESERDDGVFALSGFGFDPRQAKLFSKEWVRDFPPERPFHMTDLCARQGKFLGISEPERDRLIRSAVKTCARRVAIIVSITCNLREWERVAPPEKIGHRHPYPIFCFISMMALGEWVSKRSKSGLVSYVFEAGHEHENEAAEAARSIARDPERTRGARYFGHSFVPKEHCPLIQAAQLRSADLIAWESTKYISESVERKIRNPRQSLLALLGDRPRLTRHYTGEPLRKNVEEVEAAFAKLNAKEGR